MSNSSEKEFATDRKETDSRFGEERDKEYSFKPSVQEDYGYYFYPDRSKYISGASDDKWAWLSGRGKQIRKLKCFENVDWCLRNDPLVRLLSGALRENGCPIRPERHISCEECRSRVNGGYDPEINQIVVCHNTSVFREMCCNVVAHEMIHAFDYCRAKVDFKNVDHVACTEIRAANFMHCSFMSAWSLGDASLFGRIRARHQDCVRRKALLSVMTVRNVTKNEAVAAVDRVFDRCYADLTPLMRIPRKRSRDGYRCYIEGSLYGFTDPE